MVYLKSVENVITLGKFIGLLFLTFLMILMTKFPNFVYKENKQV